MSLSFKKQGFGAPVKDWLVKPEFTKLIDEWFTPQAHVGEYLNIEEIRKYISAFYSGNTALQYKIWILLSLESWLRSRTHYGA